MAAAPVGSLIAVLIMLQCLQVQDGLAAGRRWLWDEAARKIGILLSAPSAFEGEHFQQVSCYKSVCMCMLNVAAA